MALIRRTKDLSVNVAEIDSQHRKLIPMLNELNDAMRQDKGKDPPGAGSSATSISTREAVFKPKSRISTGTNNRRLRAIT